MLLSEYLASHAIDPAEFARRIGVTAESVRRYSRGTRIPRKPIILRISEATDGAVLATDFYRQSA